MVKKEDIGVVPCMVKSSYSLGRNTPGRRKIKSKSPQSETTLALYKCADQAGRHKMWLEK
jgi:hypothetical protein